MGTRVQIVQLLKDYNNSLPGGSGEAYVPLHSGGGDYGGWPLSPESLKRMDGRSFIGETYSQLDAALLELKRQKPILWEAIYRAYLQDDTGHSQVDFWREVAHGNGISKFSAQCRDLVERHDEAIEFLHERLKHKDLWVQFPRKAPGPKPGDKMQDRHLELVVVYQRYRSEGMSINKSVRNAAFKCDYTERHARKIINDHIPAGQR